MRTPDRVVVISSDKGKFVTHVQAGKHRSVADEPERNGGNGLGPDPYDLLLSALGACTSMTVRMYAQQKGWALERVTVRLNYNRQHAKDEEEFEQSTGWMHHIEVTLELAGDLTINQQARLRQIAERCPVHRTLTEPKDIVTKLA